MKSLLRFLTGLTQTFVVQLTLSFTAIIILMATTLGVGIYSLNQLRDESNHLVRVGKIGGELLQLRVTLLEKNFWVSRYVLLNQYQALYDYVYNQPDRLNISIRSYLALDDFAFSNQALLGRLTQSELQIRQLTNRLLLQLKADNQSDAQNLLQDEFTVEINHFNDLLMERLKTLQNTTIEQQTRTDRISTRSNYLLTGGGIGIAIISALAAVFLARYLGRRVAALRQAVEEVGQGNFEVRLSNTGQDELSRVSLAFNHMADQLNNLVIKLEARNQELEALQDFNHQLHDTINLQETADRALAIAMDVVQADIGCIYLGDEDTPTGLKLLIKRELHSDILVSAGAGCIKGDQSLVAHTFQTSQLLGVDDLDELIRHTSSATIDSAPRWKSGLFVPLITSGNTIGVLSLIALETHHFPLERRRFVETLAGQIATAIQKALLLENQRETEKLEAVLTMARTAAHELRQPLTVLQAEIDLVSQFYMPLDLDCLDRIQAAITEMNNRVSSYQRIVRYETDLTLPDAPLIDREKALVNSPKLGLI